MKKAEPFCRSPARAISEGETRQSVRVSLPLDAPASPWRGALPPEGIIRAGQRPVVSAVVGADLLEDCADGCGTAAVNHLPGGQG